MADFLNQGLSETDKRAAIVIEKYLEACNKTGLAEKTKLLAWTSLYHSQEQLQSKCMDGVSVDWFRVVCYVLDQRRLREASKFQKRIEEVSRKRQREDRDDVENDQSPRTSRSASKKLRTDESVMHELLENFPRILSIEGSDMDDALKDKNDVSISHRIQRPMLEEQHNIPFRIDGSEFQNLTISERSELGNRLSLIETLGSKFVLHWSYEITEELRQKIPNNLQPSNISNAQLCEICQCLVKWIQWIGVYSTEHNGLSHTTDYLQEILTTAANCASIQISSNTAILLANQDSVLNKRLSLQLQSDHLTFIEFNINQNYSNRHGIWQNPKFVDWLKSNEATNIIAKNLETLDSLPMYNPSGYETLQHNVNASGIFILGIISVIFDLFNEYWNRLNGVITAIRMCGSTDFLQELKILANLPILKSGSSSSRLDLGQLFAEIEQLLNRRFLPKDIHITSLPASEKISLARKEWEEIQKKNEERRKAIEEGERAKREADRQEANQRDRYRREVVAFFKEGFRRQESFPVPDPFWVLGIDPQDATDNFLRKLKKRLCLLLHPDKCLDPSHKAEANEVFLGFNSTISMAQSLLEQNKHLQTIVTLPPRGLPPYHEALKITQTSTSKKKSLRL